MRKVVLVIPAALTAGLLSLVIAQSQPGERPALGYGRITQADVTGGEMSLQQIRLEGLRIFTTLFNKLDGYGDGPMDVADPVPPGGRPTLQGNGTLLRAQRARRTQLYRVSRDGQRGHGPRPGWESAAWAGPTPTRSSCPRTSTWSDPDLDGSVIFNGRFANPPFVFGAGAVELLAAEMTRTFRR